MKINAASLILVLAMLTQCGKEKRFSVIGSENPELKKNTAFRAYEDLASPRFQVLKEKYHLDTVFRGEEDEFKRQLLLRNWIRTVIHISDFEPDYPGEGYAEEILDEGLKGQGYHCGHYMIVQNAVMNAYGYVTRCLGAGPGVKGGPDGHHGVNEIWSNKFRKWYLSDAKYDHHFEKDGIPLSALEIRDEYLKNKVADVVLVKGALRTPINTEGVANARGEIIQKTKTDFAQVYTWVEWESYNDRFTHWPDNSDSLAILNMYADEYFTKNKWIWDGKPHWAYGTEYMKLVSDRDAIEWTPNTVSSKVKIEKDIAFIELESETPNLRNYEMRRGDAEWQEIAATTQVQLNGDGEEFVFRSVNLAGVRGPEHRITITQF